MDYYDTIAQGYEELHKDEQEKKIKVIIEHLRIDSDDVLLDLGAGPCFARFPCMTIRLDPSRELLKMGRGVRIQGIAENLPFKDNSFSIVVSVTAMQNFSDASAAIIEMKRVCKGRFCLTFLKKSQKRTILEEMIREGFQVLETIEEDKDMIYIANYK